MIWTCTSFFYTPFYKQSVKSLLFFFFTFTTQYYDERFICYLYCLLVWCTSVFFCLRFFFYVFLWLLLTCLKYSLARVFVWYGVGFFFVERVVD
ncbi:hypothetical protein FPQ18DRAFT_25530 [Pyronema domesticum]|nr:hypothetical protein FPQ18DRAFT_25530 [Pyronema domesticum]